MTVWIDRPAWPRHGTTFAHLVSDANLDELHELAVRARLHPRSFDGDHYDVPEQRWSDVLAAGAVLTSARDLMLRLNASGLRLRKRHGDRGIARMRGVRVLGGDCDVDLVAATKPVPDPAFVVCLLTDLERRYACVWAPNRGEWSTPGGHIEPGEDARTAVIREIAEETGLAVDQVRPVGYERYTWASQSRVMQVYAARLDVAAPPLRAERADIPEPQWLAWPEFADRFQGFFWWPLAEHLHRDESDQCERAGLGRRAESARMGHHE